MRKNTVLAAAITTALSINVVYAGSFDNWPLTGCSTACAASGLSFDDDNDTSTAVVTVSFGNKVIQSTDKGVNFGTHLFGSNAVVLPAGSSDYLAAKYTLVGEVDFPFEFKATLSNSAQFDGTTRLEFKSKTGNNSTTQNDVQDVTSCENKTQCQWSITPTTAKLKDGDMFFIFYKLKNAQALANAGEKITLTAQLGTTFTPALIDTREITVAAGVEPLAVTFEAGTDTGIRVSVASQNTEFSSKTAGSSEFSSPQAVTMGYLKADLQGDTSNPIKASNGYTTWDLGNTDTAAGGGTAVFNAGFDSTNKVDTTLSITGGQFAASVTGSSGKVYLDINEAKGNSCSQTLTSSQIDADTVDENNATWQLSNTDLQDIVNVSKCGKIPIIIKSDGTTGINTVENNPTATLTLDYLATNNLHDLPYGPVELSKFKADGTVCWVYNVPPSGAADTLALRITNDSSAAGVINGTMYDKDGNQIFPAAGSPALNLLDKVATDTTAATTGTELAAGATQLILSSDLENLEGGPYTWTGRGILQISSTLSRLEILSLLRSIIPGSPLTNVSVGAHGIACEN